MACEIFAAQCARNVTGVSPSTTPTLRSTTTPIPRSGTNRSQSTLTAVRKKCEQHSRTHGACAPWGRVGGRATERGCGFT